MPEIETAAGSAGESAQEPSLLDQTVALATILKAVSDREPYGQPTETASRVFREWLAAARASTDVPQYFDDVAENFEVERQTNRDIFDMFELLHPYVDIVDDRPLPEDAAAAARAYISLPVL